VIFAQIKEDALTTRRRTSVRRTRSWASDAELDEKTQKTKFGIFNEGFSPKSRKTR